MARSVGIESGSGAARRLAATIAVGALVALSAFVFVEPAVHPPAGAGGKAAGGRELLGALLESGSASKRESRVRDGGSRVVLTNAAWDRLGVGQRESLAHHLDALGGAWEIRAGAAAKDSDAIVDDQPVLTSRLWAPSSPRGVVR